MFENQDRKLEPQERMVMKMNNYLKPPALSTGFAESGKSAKKRFANIFDRNNKKVFGRWCLSWPWQGVTGTMVACSKGQVSAGNGQENTSKQQVSTNKGQVSESAMDQPDGYVKKLYQYQGTNTGDNSTVAAIIHALKLYRFAAEIHRAQNG